MEPFEYFVVLSSLILGLGIAQLLTGVADIVSNLKNVKVGLAHSLAVFNVFVIHIQEWFYSYQYLYAVKTWKLPIVIFLLIYPILLFLLARMLFPTGLRGHEKDLKEYYYDQWNWFFSVLLAIVVVSFLQNVMISGEEIAFQIPQFLLAGVIIIFLLFDIKNERAHNVFMIALAVSWILWIIFDPYELAYTDSPF